MASGSNSLDGLDLDLDGSDLGVSGDPRSPSKGNSFMGDGEEDEQEECLTQMLEQGYSKGADGRSKASTSTANNSSTPLSAKRGSNISRVSMGRTIIDIQERYAKATDGLACLRNMDGPLDEEVVAKAEEVCSELDKLLTFDNSDEDAEFLDKEELALHLKTESEVAELFDASLRKTSSAIVNPASFMRKLIEPTGDFLSSPFFELPCVSDVMLLANRSLSGVTHLVAQQEEAAKKEKAPLKRNSQKMMGEVEKEAKLQTLDSEEAELERIIDTAYFTNVNNALLKVYDSSKEPIEYWSFVVDPDSFSRTAKNMFDVSCLAQAGKLKMLVEFEENNGKQVKDVHLVPLTKAESDQLSQSKNALSLAISMKLTSAIYHEKIQILGSSTPQIPPVDEIKLSHAFFQSLKKRKSS